MEIYCVFCCKECSKSGHVVFKFKYICEGCYKHIYGSCFHIVTADD